MLGILKSYELDDFVPGKHRCPCKVLDDESTSPESKFWSQQDQMIGLWLIVSMSDDLIKEVSNLDTSFEI